ncbi:MAG: BolA family protein, partial [Acidobacteriota bacterium]
MSGCQDTTREKLEDRLRREFQPVHLEIFDESDRHTGHAGRGPGGGGHFSVVIVSGRFEGKSLLHRHRMVNAVLADLMGGEIHALGLKTVLPSEW